MIDPEVQKQWQRKIRQTIAKNCPQTSLELLGQLIRFSNHLYSRQLIANFLTEIMINDDVAWVEAEIKRGNHEIIRQIIAGTGDEQVIYKLLTAEEQIIMFQTKDHLHLTAFGVEDDEVYLLLNKALEAPKYSSRKLRSK